MATVKRNILANLAGGAWIAVLTLVITPLQVNILGVESYGLLGFFTTLQMVFSVFDFGLSSTITRELAGDRSPGQTQSRPLLRTATTVFWGLALVIGVALATYSGALARFWFNPKEVDVALLEQALRVIALYLALRWPVALYGGILSGLQRMDILNAVRAATASLRLVGGIVVLLVWRDLAGFLWWTSFSAVVEVVAYALACRRVYPAMEWRPGFSLQAVESVWGYSLSMNAIAVLAILITQLDRLLVSKMLSLETFGYYSLAYNIATGISLVPSAISSAMLPSFAAAHSGGTRDVLLRRYDNANRAMLFAAGFAVFALVFFGEPILAIWISPVAAAGAWQPLALLSAGFWLGAANSNAYNIAVASRQPGVPLKMTLISVAPYALGLYWMINAFGANGAAGVWLALNVCYVLILVPTVHRKILEFPVAPWFLKTLLPFVLLGCTTFGAVRLITSRWLLDTGMVADLAALAVAALFYSALGYFLLGAGIRADLRGLMRRVAGTHEGGKA